MIQGREQERFERLWKVDKDAISGYAQGLTANLDDAADVESGALAQMWENFGNYDSEKPFLGWAKGFVLRNAQMLAKDNKRHAHEDLDDLVRREQI